MTKVLMVNCPECKEKFNYFSSEFRPFCCERCKNVDLGNWFNEGYTLEGEPSKEALQEILDQYEEE